MKFDRQKHNVAINRKISAPHRLVLLILTITRKSHSFRKLLAKIPRVNPAIFVILYLFIPSANGHSAWAYSVQRWKWVSAGLLVKWVTVFG